MEGVINAIYKGAIEGYEEVVTPYMVSDMTTDIVLVVRCKDCTKWDSGTGVCSQFSTPPHPHGGRTAFITHEGDFCSYGERRETDDGRPAL